jgi:2-C-methyl-D-erythritol 4-phosphate cytidylyltransferase
MGEACEDRPSKLLLPITEDRTVLGRSLKVLSESALIEEVVMPTIPEVRDWWKAHPDPGVTVPITFIKGGSSRAFSVHNGVEYLQSLAASRGDNPSELLVLIHDAARCMFTPELVRQCIEVASQHGAAIAAIPCTDTITRANSGGDTIEETLRREELWAVQTPQVFRLDLLVEAHQRAKELGTLEMATDDASLVEAIAPVKLVPSDKGNLKVTTPEDYEYVRYLLRFERLAKPTRDSQR